MFTYSRNYLMSLHSWWKLLKQFQISRHIGSQQEVKSLPADTWSTLKSLGLLRRSRGRRGGSSNKDCNRIRPIISVNRSNASHFKKKSKSADAEPLNILPQRSSHYGSNLSNLIIVKRQPMQPPPIRFKPLDFTLLNVRSVKNKPHIIKDFVVDNDIDLLALTETWLRSGNTDQNIIS